MGGGAEIDYGLPIVYAQYAVSSPFAVPLPGRLCFGYGSTAGSVGAFRLP